jgi:hypothetical protein
MEAKRGVAADDQKATGGTTRPRFIRSRSTDFAPTGKSVKRLSSPFCKNIFLRA